MLLDSQTAYIVSYDKVLYAIQLNKKIWKDML